MLKRDRYYLVNLDRLNENGNENPGVRTLKNLRQIVPRKERPQTHRVPGFVPLGNQHDARPTTTQRTSLWVELSPHHFPNIHFLLSLDINSITGIEEIGYLLQSMWADNERLPSQVFSSYKLLVETGEKNTEQLQKKVLELLQQGGEELIEAKLKKPVLDIWQLLLHAVERGSTEKFAQFLYVLTGIKAETFEEARSTLEYAIGRARRRSNLKQAEAQPTVRPPKNVARRKPFQERYDHR